MRIRIDQKVLRLDVSMTNAHLVNVGQCLKSLVCIQFDEENWNALLHLVIMLQDSKDSLRDIVHYYVEVDFIWLVALSVECMFKSYNIMML